MDTEKILLEMNKIFKEILDDKKISVDPKTTAAEIPQWDSLSHIQLVVAIEKFFKIKFTSSELLKFKNVGDMINSIQKRHNEKRR